MFLTEFFSQVRQEVSKVTWPTRKELVVASVTVFVMTIVAALFFLLVDKVVLEAVQLLLGLGS